MKLGIFDSGLGGLIIMKSIRDHMPDIDIVYLGDTLRLPYGNRSRVAIYNFTQRGVARLFELGCGLVILACNTASAASLRQLQQDWLPQYYPEKNILGVVVPTIEEAARKGYKKLGVIGTNYIVSSGVYAHELQKISTDVELFQKSTPLLVPLIEHEVLRWSQDILSHYLAPLIEAEIECLLLGCTHYPFLKSYIREIIGENISILSQDDIIPFKLKDYLNRHPEYGENITRRAESRFYVTDLTEGYKFSAGVIMGEHINLERIGI